MQSWRIHCLTFLCLMCWLAWPRQAIASAEAADVYSRFMQLSRTFPRLSQSTALAQDPQGFLWLGTQQGLIRFDGQHIRVFQADPNQPNSLSSDWVTSLLVDRQGLIWIGTRYGGLNRFNPATEQFSRVPLPALPGAQQQVEISSLYQDKQGELWVGTYGGGLLQWDSASASLRVVTLPLPLNELDSLYINTVWRDDAGYLWIGTGVAPLRNRSEPNGGAIRWHPQQGHRQLFSRQNSVLTVPSVTAIQSDAQGRLWLTSYGGGLYQYDSASSELRAAEQQPASLQQGLLTDLLFDAQHGLWVSSYDKGLWYKPAGALQWQNFRANPLVSYQLQSNNLTALLFDQQQTLWLNSPVGVFGLSAQAQQVRNIPAQPGRWLQHGDVFGIWSHNDQQFWLANRDGGLALLDLPANRLTRWPVPQLTGLARQPTLIRQAIELSDGQVYLGTDAGLFRFDRQSGQSQLVSLKAGAQPHVGNMHLDQQGLLWIGSRGDGLFLLKDGQVRHFNQQVRGGVTLANASISTMHSDQYNQLWVGLADQGLLRLDKQSLQLQSWQSTDDAGLRFNGIQLIFPEGEQLWIRAGNINHRVLWQDGQPTQVKGFKAYLSAADQDKYLEQAPQFLLLYRQLLQPAGMVQLGEMHGFQSTTWIGSWYVDGKGRIYRGGSQGLDIYQDSAVLRRQQPLPVRLTGLSLFNRPVEVTPAARQGILQKAIGFAEQIRLQYEQDMFSLHFSALDFVAPQSLQYRYRLNGFDRDWLETDAGSPVATYTRLAPGRYTFEVMARLPGQPWASEHGSEIRIEVLPPWWLTWWFKVLATLLVLGSLWFFMQYRLRHERQSRLWLEKVVDSRTSELKSQHLALSNSYRDMSLLQTVSRQITASLELQEILWLLHRNLRDLMDVHVLAIGVYRPEHQVLEFSHWLENGKPMPAFELVLQEEANLAAVCFNGQREVQTQTRQDFLNYLKELPTPLVGEPMQSVLYFPLMVKGEQVGCLSVQSPQQQAFAADQVSLLRTLCSTIAIAVANANAVQRLQQTRQQLVMQEKMASLGGLVAGVAHEINTPLGICVTAASHLQHELAELTELQQHKQLTIQRFNTYLDTAGATCQMLVDNTQRAASLVHSFKQVAVDRTAINIRELELSSYVAEVIRALEPELNKAGCRISVQAEPGLVLFADAGILARILTHLVMNALQHAFLPQQQHRLIEVQLSRQGNQLLLTFQDNGQGMPAELLTRLFEPFFTTKRYQGFSGLGSHIVYNLVTVELQGSIQVRSEAGQGLSYRLLFPVRHRPD